MPEYTGSRSNIEIQYLLGAGLDELNVKELISESALIWGIIKSNLQFVCFFKQAYIEEATNPSISFVYSSYLHLCKLLSVSCKKMKTKGNLENKRCL